MEFLKSCTTNLHAVEGYSSIEYQIYTAPQPDQDDGGKEREKDSETKSVTSAAPNPPWGTERYAILVELRRRGALVQSAAVQKKICVFGGFNQAEEYMAELRWPLALSSRLEVSSLNRPGPDAKANLTNQNIYGMFLSAMEESLSLTLANTCRAIRVARMIWIIPTESPDDMDPDTDSQADYALLTLRTQISAMGNLLLLPEVVATNFKIADNPTQHPKTILLAPSGTLTSIADDISTLSLVDGNKGTRYFRREARARLAQKAREDKWKSSVKTRLASTTAVPLTLDHDTRWTRIRIPTPRNSNESLARSATDRPLSSSAGQSCLWPTKLCFEKSAHLHLDDSFPSTDNMTWSDSATYRDPLSLAEEWFLKKDERINADLAERKSLQIEAEKEAAAAATGAASLPADLLPELPALSSPVNIRTQDQINVNGIYPTPPDGILAGVFTDTATSAGIVEDTAPPPITEECPPPRQLSTFSQSVMDQDISRKNDTFSQSVMDQDTSRKNSTDELFGDMDEEMFGAPDLDVTVDDFNYFNNNGNDPLPERRRRSSNRLETMHDAVAIRQTLPTIIADDESVVMDDAPTAPASDPGSAVATTHEPEPVHTEASDPGCDDTVAKSEPQSAHDSEQRKSLSSVGLSSYSPQHRLPERLRTPPLSPFQIKERFLPSPIPASSTRTSDAFSEPLQLRRSSTFDPVIFKGDITSFDAKYRNLGRFSSVTNGEAKDIAKSTGHPITLSSRNQSIINLPPKLVIPKTRRPNRNVQNSDNYDTYDDTSSYESDSDSVPSPAESEVPISNYGKRKRLLVDDGASMHSPRTHTDIESDIESTISEDRSMMDYGPVLDLLLSWETQKDSNKLMQESLHKFGERSSVWKSFNKKDSTSTESDGDMWDIFDFNQEDMIGLAQIVAQQSINTDDHGLNNTSIEDHDRPLIAAFSMAQDAVKRVLTSSSDCDFSKLASIISIHAEQAQMQRNQPKPVQTPRRAANGSSGPQHLFAIQPPAVHLQRAGSTWEMLPSSLKFWEPLSLEPASGAKDVTSYAIYPESGGFGHAVEGFLDDIGLVYENFKLGSHVRGPTYTGANDGLVSFPLLEEASSTRSMLVSMHNTCMSFGQLLSEESPEPDKPVVIYMFSPSHDTSMTKYLCACFWVFLRAFLDGLEGADDSVPDFILQVVPIDRVASSISLAVPDPDWLASLACQVYDRIPNQQPVDHKSVWLIPSAPSVQLVSPVPRKINFTLHECPPKSLLEEAQVLHVAYAISSDNTWLTCAWSDNTGRYQFNTSYWIRDVDGKTILAEVRDTTLSLCTRTTWRIFVARVGTMRIWEKEVWKELPSENYAILLLDIDTAPALHIDTTDATANHPAVPQPGAGFMTPASTPQPLGNSYGVSPEAQGAPSTPVPLESQEPLPPPDPDAYLIDATDETWGLVIPFSAVHGPYELKRCLASGILLKRGGDSSSSDGGGGGSSATKTLPSLGVDVIDMLIPKISEGQAGWLGMRTPDAVLREVLSWYRGLALLSRVRGLESTGVVPWHVRVAVLGAEALEGFV